MTKHPLYLALSVGVALYLCIANANAWSFWQGVSNAASPNSRGGAHTGFHHK